MHGFLFRIYVSHTRVWTGGKYGEVLNVYGSGSIQSLGIKNIGNQIRVKLQHQEQLKNITRHQKVKKLLKDKSNHKQLSERGKNITRQRENCGNVNGRKQQ